LLLDETVLPRAHRLRRAAEFRQVVRRGSRAAGPAVVLHQWLRADDEPVRVGFVVGRAVGNAVTRNKVKRRLRDLMAHRLSTLREHSSVVVRANPAAAGYHVSQLADDIDRGLRALASRPSGR
jgi:ribonuclease P protein component